MKYWILTIIQELPWKWKKQVLCNCECWNKKQIRLSHLKSWFVKSCWCLVKNWLLNPNRSHWMAWTRFYKCYRNIISRCNNENNRDYYLYGWRWIRCEWNSFEEFYKDMYELYVEHIKIYWEKNTTIDRINTDWNYCKENCRWATISEQSMNRRCTIIVEYKWKIYNSKQVEEKFWVPQKLFLKRLKTWFSVERAIEQRIINKPRRSTLLTHYLTSYEYK